MIKIKEGKINYNEDRFIVNFFIVFCFCFLRTSVFRMRVNEYETNEER